MSTDARLIVTRTWEASLDALAAHRVPQARLLLRLLSCYAPAVPIPADLLVDPALGELLPPPDGAPDGARWSGPDLAHGRHALARVGLMDMVDLLEATGDEHGLVIHPLVAHTNRVHLTSSATPAETAAAIRHAAVELLAHAVSSLEPIGTSDWPTWRLLTPHIHSLLTSTAPHLRADDLSTLLDAVAKAVNFHRLSGADQAGQQLGRAALAYTLDAKHPAPLRLRFQLARMAWRTGRQELAESELRQIVDDMTGVFGPDHFETLLSRANLAWTIGYQGRWEQAEPEFRQVVHDVTRHFGPDHLATVVMRGELAWIAGHSGRWEEVEPELRQTVDDVTRLLGSDHLETLLSRANHGWAVGQSGRWEQAESRLRQLLEDMTRILGPDHPDTLDVRANHAWAAGQSGRWEHYEAKYRQALEDMTRILGPDHLYTLNTQQRLADMATHLQQRRSD